MGAPTTTLTSSNNFNFVDDRSSDPLHVGVRQLEFSEVLKVSGFDDDLNATAFLKSRSEEDALKTVASAIPPPTLPHLYRAIVRHAISVLVSLHEVNGLEETFAIDLDPERDPPPCGDDDFSLFAADVVTQSVDCFADFQSGQVGMLTRQADVRTKQPSREVSTAAWPPLRPHGSIAWRRKVALVWRYHSIWHHSKEHMEQHLTGSDADNHGLERGDSRYFLLVVWIVSYVLTRRSR